MAAFDPGDWAVPLRHLVDETAWAFWLDPSGAVPPLLAGAILGLATATLIGGSARRRRDRRRRRRRARAAWQAEGAAPGWLRGLGYRVVDAQVRIPWAVRVGDRVGDVELRADLIVERHGRLFVAEVKRGALVGAVRHGPTRRQLLEYLVAFQVDGVLLVDALARRVDEVRFPDLENES